MPQLLEEQHAAPRTAAALRAVPMRLYPTLNSLEEVVALAKNTLPADTDNKAVSLLFTYHNTMLKVLSEGTPNVRTNH